MINEFIDNFRQKHGFNRQTAMLPYDDEGDSDKEPIELEGGRRMVIRRRIISPDEDTTQEEDPDRLEDLVPRRKKRSAPRPDDEESEFMGPPPGKKPKKAKTGTPKSKPTPKTPRPKKDPKPQKPKKGKKRRETPQTGRLHWWDTRGRIQLEKTLLYRGLPQDRGIQTPLKRRRRL